MFCLCYKRKKPRQDTYQPVKDLDKESSKGFDFQQKPISLHSSFLEPEKITSQPQQQSQHNIITRKISYKSQSQPVFSLEHLHHRKPSHTQADLIDMNKVVYQLPTGSRLIGLGGGSNLPSHVLASPTKPPQTESAMFIGSGVSISASGQRSLSVSMDSSIPSSVVSSPNFVK